MKYSVVPSSLNVIHWLVRFLTAVDLTLILFGDLLGLHRVFHGPRWGLFFGRWLEISSLVVLFCVATEYVLMFKKEKTSGTFTLQDKGPLLIDTGCLMILLVVWIYWVIYALSHGAL